MLLAGMPRDSWPRIALLTALVACSSNRNASSSLDGGTPDDSGTTRLDAGTAAPGHQLATLATLGGATYIMRIDSANAYVASGNSDSSLFQIPLAGGAPTRLASGQHSVPGLAVNGTTVYWVDSYLSNSEPPDAGPDGVVRSVPVGGGTTATLASGQRYPGTLAVDSTGAYWTTGGPCSGATACPANVMTVPLGGGTPVALASVTGSLPVSIALDAVNVYWGTGDGRLMKVAKTGGTPTMLAFYQARIQSLAVDAASVYWTTGTGDIMKTPIGGGASVAILVSQDEMADLTIDSTSVYFTTIGYPTSNVKKMSLIGGPPTTLWSGAAVPEAIEVDATSVYFVTESGVLMKVTPK